MGNNGSSRLFRPQAQSQPQYQSQCDTPNVLSYLSSANNRNNSYTPNPVDPCKAHKIEINQLQSDVRAKQEEIDICYPEEKKARIIAAFNARTEIFIRENEQKLYITREQLSSTWILLRKLVVSLRISDEYKSRLAKEIEKLQIEIKELEQIERRFRRNFMDNEPQSGVPLHRVGFQTSDDKSLLMFWSSLVFFLIVGIVTLNLFFGISMLGSGLISLVVLIAVFCIIYTFG